jgi:DNA-binding transcriptional ArsR family regulator
MEGYLPKEEALKRLIIAKFGSLRKFAEHIGIAPSTLHQSLKVLTRNFLVKLEQAGIDVEQINNITESTIIGTVAGNNQTVYNKGDNDKLKECEERNKLLEVEVEHLRARVKMFDEMFHFIKDQAEKKKPQP